MPHIPSTDKESITVFHHYGEIQYTFFSVFDPIFYHRK